MSAQIYSQPKLRNTRSSTSMTEIVANITSPTSASPLSLPEYGKLPVLIKAHQVVIDRTSEERNHKLGFSLRGIKARYGDGDEIYIAVVNNIVEGSLAHASGIADGDQILSVNGHSVNNMEHNKMMEIIKDSEKLNLVYLPASNRLCPSIKITQDNSLILPYLWSLKRFLHTLDIFKINLSGSNITIDISFLTGLKSLTVSFCQMSSLARLKGLSKTKLDKLNLSSNLLSNEALNVLSPIASLVSLTKLYIASNLLTELPDAIWTLTNLEILSLVQNRITTISPNITKLQQLQMLCLDNNLIKSIDVDLSVLPNLNRFSISNNDIHFASHAIRQEEFQAICIQGNPYDDFKNPLSSKRSSAISRSGKTSVTSYVKRYSDYRGSTGW